MELALQVRTQRPDLLIGWDAPGEEDTPWPQAMPCIAHLGFSVVFHSSIFGCTGMLQSRCGNIMKPNNFSKKLFFSHSFPLSPIGAYEGLAACDWVGRSCHRGPCFRTSSMLTFKDFKVIQSSQQSLSTGGLDLILCLSHIPTPIHSHSHPSSPLELLYILSRLEACAHSSIAEKTSDDCQNVH